MEIRISLYPVPSRKLQLERPLKSAIQLVKSEEFDNPRLRNPRWLLCASTAAKAGVISSFLALLSICVSLNRSYKQYCPTSVCGHVATVFVRAKCRVIRCYQLVSLTMPQHNKIFPGGVRLGFSNLSSLERGQLGCDVIPSADFRLPR